MENNNSHLEGFLKILKEQHTNSIETVNKSLYEDICNASVIFEKTDDSATKKEIIEKLRERFKDSDLNQVTDIFIYCQSFLSSNENRLPMPSMLCIAIGKSFTKGNLYYTASKVYSNDEVEGDCALFFLVYLAMHEHHTSYVLNFIKENFKGFSQNKKTECVFQLKEVLPDNETAIQIIKDSGITEYKLIFGTNIDSTSKPITFQKQKNKNSSKTNIQEPKSNLPWWKFWGKKK